MDEILKNLVDGKISIEECKTLIKSNSIMELEGIAQLDSSRKNRTGFPEAIFAEGKEYKDLQRQLWTDIREEQDEHNT